VRDRIDSLIRASDAPGTTPFIRPIESIRYSFEREGGISSQRTAQAIADPAAKPEKPE
jgi:hypothetical protein